MLNFLKFLRCLLPFFLKDEYFFIIFPLIATNQKLVNEKLKKNFVEFY